MAQVFPQVDDDTRLGLLIIYGIFMRCGELFHGFPYYTTLPPCNPRVELMLT